MFIWAIKKPLLVSNAKTFMRILAVRENINHIDIIHMRPKAVWI